MYNEEHIIIDITLISMNEVNNEATAALCYIASFPFSCSPFSHPMDMNV